MGKRGQGEGITFLRGLIGHEGDACVIWPWNRNHKGYGTVGFENKIHKANRLMCILAHGEPPTEKHQAAHSCRGGSLGCVNPKHLSWKTPRDNQMDRVRDGTMPRMGKPRRILTPEQIAEIRALKGKVAQYDLATRFGVKPGAIEYWQSHDKPSKQLTNEQIRKIREIGYSQTIKETAAQLGVTVNNVGNVLRGRVYRDVA